MPTNHEFEAIETEKLDTVAGGTTRSSTDDITTALSGITDSLKSLQSNQNQGMDPMNMILMMMMMGGFGGGGGGGVLAAPGVAAAPPVINVDTGVSGGGGGWGPGGRCGGGKGKKGW